MRRAFLVLLVPAIPLATACASSRSNEPPFEVVEATIPEMQRAMESGRITARGLVEAYLIRIALYENRLNAAITINPRALVLADSLDRERAAGRVRGPLHGIPIALKDNVHTTDMPTTVGALAFDGFVPPYAATLTKNLQDAGAIIIAKTVMTELANGMAGRGVAMPTNYSAVGGYGMNPYDPRRDPRAETGDGRPALATGGSSSGIGTSANLWAANVGTETSGSILGPATQTMLVGIKPTVGRISRWGIAPLNGDQDTAGPLARTVTDAAILMGALESATPDPKDPATTACTAPPNHDYTPFLDADALKGARIGIPRAFYFDALKAPGTDTLRGGLNPEGTKRMAEAIEVLRKEGAVIVDPANIPSVVDPDPANNFLLLAACGATVAPSGCSIPYGPKRDIDAWLATLGPAAPVKTLTELIAWNRAHQQAGSMKYGQGGLENYDQVDLVRDRARYQSELANRIRLARTHGIDEAMKANRLDALLFAGTSGAAIAAQATYPTVIVPFGVVPNAPTPPFPAGFEARPSPVGVSFTGMACSEPRLIALAYAFEQATRARVAPPLFP